MKTNEKIFDVSRLSFLLFLSRDEHQKSWPNSNKINKLKNELPKFW